MSSSTPKITATPMGPKPGTNVFKVARRMTSDARGTAATPFEVTMSVSIMTICWPIPMCTPVVASAACATKTDAMAR